jgi:hypothetical protein
MRAHGGEAGSAGLVYYDLDLRARFDDGSNTEFSWCADGCGAAGPL